MHPPGFQQTCRLDALFDVCGDALCPPTDLRIGIMFRGLQGRERGRSRGVEFFGRHLAVLKLLAAELADPARDAPGISRTGRSRQRQAGRYSERGEGRSEFTFNATHSEQTPQT